MQKQESLHLILTRASFPLNMVGWREVRETEVRTGTPQGRGDPDNYCRHLRAGVNQQVEISPLILSFKRNQFKRIIIIIIKKPSCPRRGGQGAQLALPGLARRCQQSAAHASPGSRSRFAGFSASHPDSPAKSSSESAPPRVPRLNKSFLLQRPLRAPLSVLTVTLAQRSPALTGSHPVALGSMPACPAHTPGNLGLSPRASRQGSGLGNTRAFFAICQAQGGRLDGDTKYVSLIQPRNASGSLTW